MAKGHTGTFQGHGNVLCPSWGNVYRVYSFITGHLPVHLKCMNFIMYKLHLNINNFLKKKNMGRKVARVVFLSLAT